MESAKYVKQFGKVKVGHASYTKPGKLPCDILIHAVGPVYTSGKCKEDKLLAGAITTALEIAQRKEAAVIAIPAVSSGIYNYPVAECTKVICTAVGEFLKKKNSRQLLKEVHFVDNRHNVIEEFENAADNVFGIGTGKSEK